MDGDITAIPHKFLYGGIKQVLKDNLKKRGVGYSAVLMVAGATGLSIPIAFAGLQATLQGKGPGDISYSVNCEVESVIPDGLGGYAVTMAAGEEDCLPPNVNFRRNNDNLVFLPNPADMGFIGGCMLSDISFTAVDRVVINTADQCFADIDEDEVVDLYDPDLFNPITVYDCYIDDNNNAWIHHMDAFPDGYICDPSLPESLVVGNSHIQSDGSTPAPAVPPVVEFRTKGSIKILPLFSVAEEHIFIANAGMSGISGNP
ncbi:hypothetical protein [Thiolapillus sp.]